MKCRAVMKIREAAAAAANGWRCVMAIEDWMILARFCNGDNESITIFMEMMMVVMKRVLRIINGEWRNCSLEGVCDLRKRFDF